MADKFIWCTRDAFFEKNLKPKLPLLNLPQAPFFLKEIVFFLLPLICPKYSSIWYYQIINQKMLN
jgi:hypothetical protein